MQHFPRARTGHDRASRRSPWIAAVSASVLAAIVPVSALPSAIAQTAPSSDRDRTVPNQPALFRRSTVLPTGTTIPVRYAGEAERIVVAPTETADATFAVRTAVTRGGAVVIPAGSQLTGRVEPAGDGQTGRMRLVAQTLTLPDGRTLSLSASSDALGRPETLREGADTDDILKGAAIGAAAATVLSEILGSIDLWEVLAGAGAGAVGGVLTGRRSTEVVVIEATDLTLTLRSPLEVAR